MIFPIRSGNVDSKYPYLAKLIKAVLSLSHGQASVERRFSLSKRLLTREWSCLKEETIIGLRQCKDAILQNESSANIPINQGILKAY